MVLTRSDSSQSAWVVPVVGDDEDEIKDQRRIRNLCAILVRNLSLDPSLDNDQATSLLTSTSTWNHHRLSLDLGSPTSSSSSRPSLPSRQSWAEGLSSSEAGTSSKSAGGRRRAGSTASWSGGFGEADLAGEGRGGEREIVLLDGGTKRPFSGSRTRAQRSSSAATLLTRAPTSRIDEEDLVTSPEAGPSASTSTSFPSTSSSSSRPRSSSRLSNASIQSSSTIRQAPRLPTTQQPPERPPPPTSSQFAQKEKRRRDDALQRRLVDSFVTLELIPPETTEEGGGDRPSSPVHDRRKKGNAVVVPSASSVSSSTRIQRSSSNSSIRSFTTTFDSSSSSPRKSMRRRRTQSSSFLPISDSTQPAASTSTSTSPPPHDSKPFYISSPSPSPSMHPSFPIDRDHFVLPTPPSSPASSSSSSSSSSSFSSSSASFTLDALDRVDHWPGLREDRVRAKVFVRRRGEGGEEDGEGKGKGKEKEQEVESEDKEEEGWTCLVEWEVALDGLTSLGRDPTAFPPLPPNTLIFALSPTTSFSPSFSSSSSSLADLEYFTAPLPLLHKALRRTLRAQRGGGGRRERWREAVSEDEFGLGGESEEEGCSTCEEEAAEEREGDALGALRARRGRGEDDGNLSDPGISTTTSASAGAGAVGRPRSGTLTLRSKRDTRRRLLAERLRLEEERRRRKEVVEKSRRETRMVKAAEWGEVKGLWEGERELERLWGECGGLRGRVERGLEEGGEELKREEAELRDRVEDLEAVKVAEEEELVEEREALDARRAELQARRARLEAAKMLDEDNSQQLERWRQDLDGTDRALAQLASSARTRRTQLITLLSSIFPIEPVLPSSTIPNPPPLLFTICGIPLPNSSFSPPYNDDDFISSALGYAAQLTQMLAAYLAVPLCYPIKCCGSRSTITDGISMMKGPRAFPLYRKGVDGYRFDYGVFVLNKNIEQLMYSQSLTVLDLRNTLPNLKTLLLSLSYDPSHSDYRASTLLPVAPFLPPNQNDLSEPPSAADEPSRSRSPSPAASSDDSAAGSSASDTADSTPASSTGSLPPRREGDDTNESSSAIGTTTTRMSRSSSLASTIRARSKSPTPTVRGGDGTDVGGTARTSSPSPSVRSNGPGSAGGTNGHPDSSSASPSSSSSSASPSSSSSSAEKLPRPRPSPPPSIDFAAPAPSVPLKLKTQLHKKKDPRSSSGRSRSSSGSSTASGYGKRFADGLWSAVAGRPAGGGGGAGGGREKGKEVASAAAGAAVESEAVAAT